MRSSGTPEPEQRTTTKPPKRYWQASEPFFDFRASHWVEIILTAAIVVVGLLQFGVYTRQAKIMKDQATLAGIQADISNRQSEITALSQRAFVSAKELRVVKVNQPVPGQPSTTVAYRGASCNGQGWRWLGGGAARSTRR